MSMQSLVWHEYTKHLRNNLYPNICWGIGLLIVSIIIVFAYISAVSPINSNLSVISNAYEHIVESDEDYDYSFMFQFEELITVSSDNGKTINCNVYMYGNGESGMLDQARALSDNEIAISETIARKLGVSEGDLVLLDLPYSADLKEYTIRLVTSPIWNYYEVLKNTDFSVAYIGFNEDVKTNAMLKREYFLNADEYNSFMLSNCSYKRHYEMDHERKELINLINVITFICAVSISIASIFAAVMLNASIKNEVTKYYYDGYGQNITRMFYVRDFIVFYVIEQLAVTAICAILVFTISNMIVLFLAALFDMLVGLFIMFKGVRIYGKAY